MHRFISQIALLALLPALSNAVSLSDMAPRAQNLPQACNSIYTSQINGCAPSDFQKRSCSQSCIAALTALVSPIEQACGNQGVQGQNLIVAFLAHQGPGAICTNAPEGSGDGEPASSSAQPSSTPQSTTTTAAPATTEISSTTSTAESTPSETSTLLVDTTSTTATSQSSATSHTSKPTTKFVGTATAQSTSLPTYAATTSGGVLADTSSTSTASKTSTSSESSQTNLNDHSGGGSPFDTEGNLANVAPGLSASSLLSSLAVLAALVMR